MLQSVLFYLFGVNLRVDHGKNKQRNKKNRKKRSINGATKGIEGMNEWECIPDQSNEKVFKADTKKAGAVVDPKVLSQLPPLDKVANEISTSYRSQHLSDLLTLSNRQNEEVLALARDSVAFVKASSQQSLLLLKEQIQALKEKHKELMEENDKANRKIDLLEEQLLKERRVREDLETLQGFS